MDPKQTNNPPLDPKLQEVYDRVMGTPTGTASTPPAGSPAPIDPITPSTPPSNPAEPPMPANPMQTPPAMPGGATPSDPMTNPNPVVPPVMPSDPTAPVVPPVMPDTQPAAPTMPIDSTPNPVNPVMPPMPDANAPADNPVQNLENPMPQPPMPEPSLPKTPTTDDGAGVDPIAPEQPPVQPTASEPDTMHATMPMQHHSEETVKIGMGGSPVGVASHPKGQGLSPVILIFGAFAFLVVYAVFWVRFFGYSLPFLSQ